MKKCFLIVSISFLVIGCVATPKHYLRSLEVRARNSFNLLKLKVGMKKNEVLDIMGTDQIQTYAVLPEDPKIIQNRGDFQYLPQERINNPFKIRLIRRGPYRIEVLYYYTEITPGKEMRIRNEELTPIVIQNGVLRGWGQEFYQNYVENFGFLREK